MNVVVGAAIVRGGLLLVGQRAHPPALAGLWELPGGKVETGEDERAALVRECREELGVGITVLERVGIDVALSEEWTLRAYAAQLIDGEPQPLEHLELRWLDAAALAELDWLPANAVLVPALRQWLHAAAPSQPA